MLSLSNVGVEMATSYFEGDDYYSSSDEPAKPEFYGKAFQKMGLPNIFNREIFDHLVAGYRKDGSAQLVAFKTPTSSDF